MIFFDFFSVENDISCFTLSRLLSLNIGERFNWIRWTFIFKKLFRFHSVWNRIRFLARTHKAKLALQNMRSRVRSRSFKLLNVGERFNWIRWTFILKLFRFHSVWNWIRFLVQARKAKLALQNMRSRVRSRSLKRLILRRLHQSVAEGTERPLMQLWQVQNHEAQTNSSSKNNTRD